MKRKEATGMTDAFSETEPRQRYFVGLVMGFLLGICSGLYCPISKEFLTDFILYSASFLGILLLLCAAVGFLSAKRSGTARNLFFIWGILLFFCLGILRVYFYDYVQYADFKAAAKSGCYYLGVLTDNPSPSNSGKTLGFPVRVFASEIEDVRQNLNGSLMLYTPPEVAEGLKRGDIIGFVAELKKPDGAPYPGGFSTRDFLYRQNLCFSAYIKTLDLRPDQFYTPTLFFRFQNLGTAVQESILTSVDRSFNNHTQESALLKGILMGIRDDFTAEQYQSFSDSGLIHITAVSGMHVMFLVSALSFFTRKLRLPGQMAHLITAAALIIFAAAAAFTPSVCRSVITMLLFILAMLLQKEPDGLTSLAVAAFLLLSINPYTLTSYSFLLSFSSTLGILLFAGPYLAWEQRLASRLFGRSGYSVTRPSNRLLSYGKTYLLSSFSLTLASQTGILYFSMRFFRRITWGSIFGNIVVLPLAAGCFVLGLLNWPISLILPSLSRLIANFILYPALWLMNRTASLCALPLFRIPTPTPPVSFLAIYILLCGMLYFSLTLKEKKK